MHDSFNVASPSLLRRRQFLERSVQGVFLLAAGQLSLPQAAVVQRAGSEIAIDDPQGLLGRAESPVCVSVALTARWRRVAERGRLGLAESSNRSGAAIPVQVLGAVGDQTRLCWRLPAGPSGRRLFKLTERAEGPPDLRVARDPASGQYVISESGKPVLQYNYATVEPGPVLNSVAESNRKYAVARSDYIHPLYGLNGERLTKDWSVDHPHHRGIYWAWPEVDWRGQRGDLHALQRVFARPTGKCEVLSGPVFAQIDAENVWRWEDKDAIVRERALIRVFRATEKGRLLDLEFRFEAIDEPVQLARRDTTHYGGLNLRLSAIKNQEFTKHTDPPGSDPRQVWSDASGQFDASEKTSGLALFQCAANPHYPGDWVEYPELNWLQPTFPSSGVRYELRKGAPLTLRFRLWIHPGGKIADATAADYWLAANSPVSTLV